MTERLKDRMLKLVRCNAAQSSTGLQAGSQKDAGSDGRMRNDLQMVSLRVTADPHKFGNPRVPHFRLNDVSSPAVNTEPGVVNSSPFLTDRDCLARVLRNPA